MNRTRKIIATLIAAASLSVMLAASASAAPGTSYSSEVLADSPFLYWKLNGPSAFAFQDSSPNSHGGLTSGLVPTFTAPLINDRGTSLQVTPVGGALNNWAAPAGGTPYQAPGFLSNAGVTLEIWAKGNTSASTPGFPTEDVIVGMQGINVVGGVPTALRLLGITNLSDCFNFEQFGCEAGLGVSWNIQDPGGASSASGLGLLDANTPNHLVLTSDSSATRFFVNGVQKDLNGEAAGLDGLGLDSTDAAMLAGTVIGETTYGGGYGVGGGGADVGYTGEVDEVAIYPSALSAGRVANHYARGTASFYPAAPAVNEVVVAAPTGGGTVQPRTVAVSWTTPAWTGCGAANAGCVIGSYQVAANNVDVPSNPALTCTTVTTTCNVTNLIYGDHYTFTVTAANSVYPSDFSEAGTEPGLPPLNQQVVIKELQQVSFPLPGTKVYGAADFNTGSSSSSGLPVTTTSSTPLVCSTPTSTTVRILSIGTCTLNATQAGNGAADPAVSQQRSFAVERKVLTVTGGTGVSKEYDGGIAVGVTGGALNGVVGGDPVGLTIPAGGTLSAGPNAGTDMPVTATYALSGATANYTLSQPSLTVNISRRPLSINGVTVQSKEYDGNTRAALQGGTLINAVSGDDVGLGGIPVGAFDNNAVGTNKLVTASGYELTGGAKSNYVLVMPSGLTGAITAAPRLKVNKPGPVRYNKNSVIVTLKGYAPSSGKIALNIQTTVKKSKQLCKNQKTMKAAGNFTMTCKLDAKTRKQLRTKTLKVRSVLTFTPAKTVAGTVKTSMMFTLAGKR